MAEKNYPTQAEKVKQITDQLEQGISELFESAAYKSFLTVMSRFHDYSLNNTLLIASQMPEATLVAGYGAWQKQFGRQVQKGSKAIRILAPAPYKKQAEVDKIDPHTGQVVKNPDGSHAKETREIVIPAFKVVNVFDVSQTDGKELPTIGVDELTGSVERYTDFMTALKDSCPVPIAFEDIVSGAKGYFHTVENRIAIQSGMSEVQTVKTVIHEMAHQKLHSIQAKDAPEPAQLPEPGREKLTRNTKEVEAESVAFTVCQHFGIETADYSFAYIAGWSQGKDTPELKASLGVIRTAASEMITDIETRLQELTKARTPELEATEVGPKAEPAPGLQENGLYRYYSTQRPVGPGTFPMTGQKPVNVENFDKRIMVENDTIRAWGYLEMKEPYTQEQLSNYELVAAPTRPPAEKREAETEKGSVLADLKARQEPVNTDREKPGTGTKPKRKEEAR